MVPASSAAGFSQSHTRRHGNRAAGLRLVGRGGATTEDELSHQEGAIVCTDRLEVGSLTVS